MNRIISIVVCLTLLPLGWVSDDSLALALSPNRNADSAQADLCEVFLDLEALYGQQTIAALESLVEEVGIAAVVEFADAVDTHSAEVAYKAADMIEDYSAETIVIAAELIDEYGYEFLLAISDAINTYGIEAVDAIATFLANQGGTISIVLSRILDSGADLLGRLQRILSGENVPRWLKPLRPATGALKTALESMAQLTRDYGEEALRGLSGILDVHGKRALKSISQLTQNYGDDFMLQISRLAREYGSDTIQFVAQYTKTHGDGILRIIIQRIGVSQLQALEAYADVVRIYGDAMQTTSEYCANSTSLPSISGSICPIEGFHAYIPNRGNPVTMYQGTTIERSGVATARPGDCYRIIHVDTSDGGWILVLTQDAQQLWLTMQDDVEVRE